MGTQNTFVTCKEIGFNAAFSKAPTVLVTANHEDPSQHDWSSEDAHPSTMTWVNGVSKDSFKVCSSERSQSSLQDLDHAQVGLGGYRGACREHYAVQQPRRCRQLRP